MRIDRLQVRHLRNFRELELWPDPGLNLICGPNASGKTALLEGIHLLARARSFRTVRIEDVVQRGSLGLQVTALIQHHSDGAIATGIERSNGRWLLRYNGEAVKSVSAHARKFPLVIATPDSQQLMLGGPRLRRHWLDWALFHVEPGYLALWREYYRALRQRNLQLKRGAVESETDPWDELLTRAAEPLTGMREEFVTRLRGSLAEHYGTATECAAPSVRLSRGWGRDSPLRQQLRDMFPDDARSGSTSLGPHRADLVFAAGDSELSAWYSRGQAKEFLVLLMLAQAEVIAAQTGEEPLLLLDDFAAELDAAAQSRLLAVLKKRPGQSFLTSTNLASDWDPSGKIARFHVEHGKALRC